MLPKCNCFGLPANLATVTRLEAILYTISLLTCGRVACAFQDYMSVHVAYHCLAFHLHFYQEYIMGRKGEYQTAL